MSRKYRFSLYNQTYNSCIYFSTIIGTINSGRSIDRCWQATTASFAYILLKIEIKTYSLTQSTKPMISCSFNRCDIRGANDHVGRVVRSLKNTNDHSNIFFKYIYS